MRKLWFSSPIAAALFLSLLLAVACKRHTAAETEQTADTSTMRVDTTLTQPDRTNVEPDSVPSAGSNQPQNVPNTTGGDVKTPGSKPKPGSMSKVDSIKASYPPKKK